MTAAIIVGLLAAGGTYLILQRGIVRIALGFVLLGHAATTMLVTSGGVGRRGIPFIGESGELADPLPQAFALTAIVISFGITAFLLTLAFRGRDTLGHDDIEDVHDRHLPASRQGADVADMGGAHVAADAAGRDGRPSDRGTDPPSGSRHQTGGDA